MAPVGERGEGEAKKERVELRGIAISIEFLLAVLSPLNCLFVGRGMLCSP